MHLIPLVQDLAVIMAIAALTSILFQKIKQPVVLGYLVAGMLIGPNTPPFTWVTDMEGIRTWSELGVIFMMFGLGLEFSFKRIAKVGAAALVAGLFEATAMLLLGFGFGHFMGWNPIDSLFLGAILSISSTAIIIKTLEELNLKQKRFYDLIFGILLVEDVIGILMLLIFSSFLGDQSNSASMSGVLWIAGKLLIVITAWIVFVFPLVVRGMNRFGKTCKDETLLLLALGLCLSTVVAALHFRYSAALGAFIVGSTLAGSMQSARIDQLAKPLRDTFAAVFFVSVGMLLNPLEVFKHWPMILGLTLMTIIGKILSAVLGTKLVGESWKTSVHVGFALAQIGEFSFIFAALGTTLGVTSSFLYPIAVAVSVLTTFATPYLIAISQRWKSSVALSSK